ncbi:MAG: ABC transporter permease [Chloroflexi bacterium]|nr:ABC transporter permease [Chloroflexota bacterium]
MIIQMAFRYLTGRKLRTVLTTLAVVFGVLIVFGMNILIPSLLQAFQANVLAASGLVDITVTSVTGEAFPAELVNQVSGIDGISAWAPSLDREINLPADFYDGNSAVADRISAIALVGIDPQAAPTVRVYHIHSGRFLEAGDTSAAVISQSMADALGVQPGQSFALPTINGVVHLQVAGILPLQPRLLPGNEEVLVTLPQAQQMTGLQGKINIIDLNMSTTDEARRRSIQQAVEGAVGPQYHVGVLPAGSDVLASVKLAQAAFTMLGFLALFMGGFIIFNTFRTIVAERRHDIGMLRAVGASRRTIVALILVEGLLQGVIGTVLGLLLGYLLGAGVLQLVGPTMTQFVHVQVGGPLVSPGLLLTTILLGVGVTVLSGLIPAVQASRVTPLEALRPPVAEIEYGWKSRAGFIAGMVLIALALLAIISQQLSLVLLGGLCLLVGLVLVAPALVWPLSSIFSRLITLLYARDGVAQLAEGNLTRQPTRSAITASATMIGLALIVAGGAMIASLLGTVTDITRKSLGSDYVFVPPSIGLWASDIGSAPEFADHLRAVEGVADVSTLRFASTQVKGQPISLLGIDPVTFPRVSGLQFQQGDEFAYRALAQERALIVNGAFLAATGSKMGDTVALATPDGARTYRIAAVGADILNVKVTTAYVSQANLKADFGKQEDVFIQLNLRPGADSPAAEQKIRALTAGYPQFKLIAGRTYIQDLLQQTTAAFVGLFIMLIFLALPSLIAMLNTLAIGVIERTREIGMLRAVGATRRQISRLVVAEALLLAALGTAFGLLAGLYLGYVMVSGLGTIFPMAYSFPVAGMLAAIAVGLIFGVLAAIIPARQAARLEVVQALRYE